jgi:competence protein ComEA
VLLFVLVLLVIAGLILVQALRPRPQPLILSTATPWPSPAATATPHPLRVYVSGAVLHPDVYTLPPDSIVKDAIVVAGGATTDADLDRINLALPVVDGQHVYVPRLGEQDLPLPSRSGSSVSDGKININTAAAEELESLPGIGPSLAQRIVEYRQAHGPFARVEDLTQVSGIGPGILEKIRDLITID